MVDRDIKLTPIADKNKLLASIEKTKNIFTVCKRTIDMEILNPLNKFSSAVSSPTSIPGWSRDWSEDERFIFNEANSLQKCQDLDKIAKKSQVEFENLSTDLDNVRLDFGSLRDSALELQEYANKLVGVAYSIEQKLNLVKAKSDISAKEKDWVSKAEPEIDKYFGSYKALEELMPVVNELQDGFVDNILGLGTLFFCDEPSDDKIVMRQKPEEVVTNINALYTSAKTTCEYQAEIVSKIDDFWASVKVQCSDLQGISANLLNESHKQYDDAQQFLDSLDDNS